MTNTKNNSSWCNLLVFRVLHLRYISVVLGFLLSIALMLHGTGMYGLFAYIFCEQNGHIQKDM